ncbi:MAG TPA: histidine phosphatase family protein [Chthoniobacterales bacterium]|nr:histidine phosphatase family protein [Chthoniobacterales bacterium]
MVLTFMRHPTIDATGERCIGQTDVELSPEGQTALISLAEKACRQRPDRILCSDLQRCRLLAEAIAIRRGGLCVEPDPIWREVSFGRWENRRWSDIQAKEPRALSDWIADFEKVTPPGGESFRQLQARVISAICRLTVSVCNASNGGHVGTHCLLPPIRAGGPRQADASTGHVLVVTHAGVIRAVVSAFSSLPLRRAFQYPVPYGGQTSFYWNGTNWSIRDITGSGIF